MQLKTKYTHKCYNCRCQTAKFHVCFLLCTPHFQCNKPFYKLNVFQQLFTNYLSVCHVTEIIENIQKKSKKPVTPQCFRLCCVMPLNSSVVKSNNQSIQDFFEFFVIVNDFADAFFKMGMQLLEFFCAFIFAENYLNYRNCNFTKLFCTVFRSDVCKLDLLTGLMFDERDSNRALTECAF